MPVVPADSPPADAGASGGGGSGDDDVTLATTPPSSASDAPPAAATEPLKPKGAAEDAAKSPKMMATLLSLMTMMTAMSDRISSIEDHTSPASSSAGATPAHTVTRDLFGKVPASTPSLAARKQAQEDVLERFAKEFAVAPLYQRKPATARPGWEVKSPAGGPLRCLLL